LSKFIILNLDINEVLNYSIFMRLFFIISISSTYTPTTNSHHFKASHTHHFKLELYALT